MSRLLQYVSPYQSLFARCYRYFNDKWFVLLFRLSLFGCMKFDFEWVDFGKLIIISSDFLGKVVYVWTHTYKLTILQSKSTISGL